MEHSLDVTKLEQIFDTLFENAHKLTPWEVDRLEEWHPKWKNGGTLSDKQLGCIERMYVKV